METFNLALRVAATATAFEAMRLTGAPAAARARYLADSAQRLGPTFVKLAQFASTRKDVLPAEYAAVFKTLHKDVRSDDPAATVENFRARLPGDPYSFFDGFDPVPIAAGSIAQVHRAVYQGKDVAVKIVKRGVEARVERELSVLRLALSLAARVDRGGERADYFGTLLQQYGDTLAREMDMTLEGETMLAARQHLSFSDFDVVIPKPLCVRRGGVLVMDFVKSRDVLLARRADEMASTIMESCLYQIFSGGPFNCDPHEGNLGVFGANTLVLYDYGNSMALDPEFLSGMFDSLVAFQFRDKDRLIRTLLQRGFIRGKTVAGGEQGGANKAEELRVMGRLIEQMFAYVKTMDIASFNTDEFREGSVMLSPDLYSVMRTILMTEGICKSMSVEFNVERAIEGFIEKHAFELVMRRGMNDITRSLDRNA